MKLVFKLAQDYIKNEFQSGFNAPGKMVAFVVGFRDGKSTFVKLVEERTSVRRFNPLVVELIGISEEEV